MSKRGFFILSYFLIVFFLPTVLFLISFVVNTFLFCELNSFVYDQIESGVAFFLGKIGKTWTCREWQKTVERLSNKFFEILTPLFFLSFSTIWMSEWVDRGLQIDKILIDRLIELLIGLTQKEIVSWNQILWVLSKCILHFYSEYLISQKVIIILDDFILRLTNREHFKWKIHFRVLVSESSRMYVCLNLYISEF